MSTHIALLRAVNVGGRKVSMAELREAIAALDGFENVRTLLQTGNLVFEASGPDAGLEQRIEDAVEATFGLRSEAMVRSASEWDEAIAANPFAKEAREIPAYTVLSALKAEPVEGGLEALRAVIPGNERVEIVGRNAYFVYPDGQGVSKLMPAMIERRLGVRGTARNWNTVLKLQAMAAA
ncbi:MAG: DUF1697 domain-containing protein [Proteobacteria bacterium]|nr:DUF1697 domain-containing protein [Pseudomonadota bacterium]